MLTRVLKHYRGTVVFYVINGIVETAIRALAVVLFQRLLDLIPAARHLSDISSLLLSYGLLLGLSAVLAYVDEYPMRLLMNGIYHKLRLMALEKVTRLDYQAYQELGTGRLIKTVENGAVAGRNIIFDFYIYTITYIIPGIVINLTLIGAYNLKVMLAIAAGYLVILIITKLLLGYLYQIKNRILAGEEELSHYSIRGFMELIVFRVNKRYRAELERLNTTADGIVRSRAKVRMIHELFFALFELIVTAIKLVIIYYGALQVISGQSTVGAIVALVTFTGRIYAPIAIFNVKFVDYKLDRVAYDRLQNLLSLPEDHNLEHGQTPTITEGRIEFRNVSFDYRGSQVLKDLSFTVPGGSSVAIVGKSGAGKSTIVKIILGLLKYTDGSVLIDGQELSSIKLNEYYDYVSYVSQNTPVFDGTIRENIVFDREVSDKQILEALTMVELKDMVSKLPHGLDTSIGEKGLKLSGGERQRLALARVFFQESPIVILDEPTSALDSITEEKIMQQVLTLLKGRTVITVAHRLQTVRAADKIVVLDEGHICEQGSFDELMQRGGLFRELWEAQFNCQDHHFERGGNQLFAKLSTKEEI